ncbi:RxLR effector protein [Phytophthora megakarya]|uniref:RxLR effector protein n=1 Tax=Phytophthora megakarya TaxID=4795 RepID=A0A225WRP5_9STRA|nr:RxLR effector protein [Phytophthora megakarya]
MSLFRILQKIVLILVVGIRSTGTVAEIVTKSSSFSDAVVNKLNSIRGRALRINKLDKTDEFARASNEERTNGIASKLSKLLDTISNKFQIKTA